MSELFLLPRPRQLLREASQFVAADGQLLVLEQDAAHASRRVAEQLQAALDRHAGLRWHVAEGEAASDPQVGMRIRLREDDIMSPQGYKLAISPAGIEITAADPAGVFYGVTTLVQIVAQCGRRLPAMRIRDWPDFLHRGVMLDISRDRVPTMETLYDLVDLLASIKINQLQLYTEHTFAYPGHEVVWAEASPMTGPEIEALDAYCTQRFIELVPNQNCFGHMHRWLQLDQYRHLAECPRGCDTAWQRIDEPFSLCPTDPGSLALVRELLTELLPHFRSRQVNVGCDETADVGWGRSKQAAEEKGVGRVYLDFLLRIHEAVKDQGRTMQFWGDIILNHPDLIAELPRDSIVLCWGYEAEHPFGTEAERFAQAQMPFFVCPGISSWNSLAGRTNNMLENIRNAALQGQRHGAIGFLNTDWGDHGHWHPLPVSYLGYGWGAAASWAYEANTELDVVETVSRHLFRDATGTMGKVAADLGNAYLQTGAVLPNSTVLFWMLQRTPANHAPLGEWISSGGLDASKLTETADYMQQAISRLPQAEMQRPDASLIEREFRWVAAMLQHACRRYVWMTRSGAEGRARPSAAALAREIDELISAYHDLWHARSRPGGYVDSVARMQMLRDAYYGAGETTA